jgi:phenylpropionate dioxygenase-like ring-hydroxylating dioxygenase large terminal subunit
MTLTTGWYAVALANGLEAGTSAGTRLFGKELVIWRDKAGKSHIWEDRCPHRGMRLSFGFVRGNHIACLYHGWQYDEAGLCRYIPAHPKLEVPDTIRVTRYLSTESGGMLWVWSGAEGDATAPPADVPGIAVRSLYIDVAPETVMAALDGGTPWNFVSEADGVFATELDGAGVRLALQPFTDDRTALHIVLAGDTARLGDIAVWAEEFRGLVEKLPAASPSVEAA